MSKKKVLIPIAVVLVAILITAALIAARPEVESVAPERVVPVVRTVEAIPRDVRVMIESRGTVEARRRTEIVPEVGGRIVSTAESFGPGGYFRDGEPLVQLDPRDYQTAVSRAEAAIAQARTRLAREEAEANIAADEWDELGEGAPPSPLVLRKPQIAEARAGAEAAEAVLEQARLDLSRTTIRAPFAGRILRKMADVGQFVAPGMPIATMYSADYAEVELPVTSEDLGFIELSAADGGPRVILTGDLGGTTRRWEGRIIRTSGQIDPQTRMASLIARVRDPFGGSAGEIPLQVGLFVNAAIEGVELREVFVLPRSALRGRDRVFLAEEGKLRIRDVGVVRTSADEVIIGSGLAAGDEVIVSPLDTPVEGMSVRLTDAAKTIDGEPVEEIR